MYQDHPPDVRYVLIYLEFHLFTVHDAINRPISVFAGFGLYPCYTQTHTYKDSEKHTQFNYQGPRRQCQSATKHYRQYKRPRCKNVHSNCPLGIAPVAPPSSTNVTRRSAGHSWWCRSGGSRRCGASAGYFASRCWVHLRSSLFISQRRNDTPYKSIATDGR